MELCPPCGVLLTWGAWSWEDLLISFRAAPSCLLSELVATEYTSTAPATTAAQSRAYLARRIRSSACWRCNISAGVFAMFCTGFVAILTSSSANCNGCVLRAFGPGPVSKATPSARQSASACTHVQHLTCSKTIDAYEARFLCQVGRQAGAVHKFL
jgi:hypothetical protein